MYSQIIYSFVFIWFLDREFSINAITIDNNSVLKRKILTTQDKTNGENFEEKSNIIGARVKREKSKKNNRAKLQASYLEDLAASFPKSEHELEDENLISIATDKIIDDDKVFKRSSISDNGKRFVQSCHRKMNRNLENPRFIKYSQIYKINSNVDDVQQNGNSHVNQHEIFSTENDENSTTDADEVKYFKNSKLHNFGNSNLETAKNFPSRNKRICHKLHSELMQSEQKRKVNLKNDTNTDKPVGQKGLMRDKRRMKKSEKKHFKKSKKNTKKHNKYHKKDKKNKNSVKHSRNLKKLV